MTVNPLIPCIRREYEQWPRQALTVPQAARLWSAEEASCAAAFGALIRVGFLTRRADGRFTRRDQEYETRPMVERCRMRDQRGIVMNAVEMRQVPARKPFPASIPRPAKRVSDRTTSDRVTAHVRLLGAELDEATCDYIRRKLGTKLAKFATSLERVSVRVTDVNGPRGGIDQLCLVKVVLSRLPSVVVERRRPHAQAAIDAAIRAVEHAVNRRVGRRRLLPLHRRRGYDR
jgi:hypothetical protein